MITCTVEVDRRRKYEIEIKGTFREEKYRYTVTRIDAGSRKVIGAGSIWHLRNVEHDALDLLAQALNVKAEEDKP